MANTNQGGSTQNNQSYGHEEGQMRNTPAGSSNNSQGMSDIMKGQPQRHSGTSQGNGDSQQTGSSGETESDRANRNEDEGVRGGNSSI
ncbi:hypothetical protein [Flaviaesturariibacter amylovorans]|uniref:Stress-induced protein n=1 Tax=Flaviaesturariibacter amylovorans TaxID=1084520 RepID=A0ABP8GGE1_9BACT